MGPFEDLRRLADYFVALPSVSARPARPSLAAPAIEKLVGRLGVTAVPLLGRELASGDPRRRDASRAALAHLAAGGDAEPAVRARVIAELHKIAASAPSDEGKVCAVGLLAELGERGAARFANPSAIQRRSAIALAAELATPSDVAAAADMMIRQLHTDDLLVLVEVMADAEPAATHRLGSELCARLDLDPELRERIAHVALPELHAVPAATTAQAAARRAPRPTHVAVLVDAAARVVVVASRKVSGEKRWRRWAVLIDRDGAIDDCLHEEVSGADGDHAPLVAKLVADGYRVASSDLERARGLVAAAARHTALTPGRLTSSYYLGRDLLDLGEAHLGGRVHAHPTSSTLGRAVELIAEADLPRARTLLAHCDPASADVAAATAACLLAQGLAADAIAPLSRALELEPEFPLHHWNLAAALHQLGDLAGCHHALTRFVATSAAPTGLHGDPDQPGRAALAERLLADLERTARLAGTALARPRRKRRTTRRTATRR